MRKITVISSITLDGVIQAMGSKDEDTSNDFQHGGWTASYGDEISNKVLREELSQDVDYLLGRKTFEIWENYWPMHGDFWPRINEGNKHILSNTRNQTAWQHTIFLQNIEDIIRLKNENGNDLQVWGSSQLVHLLLHHDLVDELTLKIFPLILGHGKKLFDHQSAPIAFDLVNTVISETGIIIARYKRNGEVIVG